MTVLQGLIPEVIPSQKCHTNIGQISNCTGLWMFETEDDLKLTENFRVIRAPYSIENSIVRFLSSVYFQFIRHVSFVTRGNLGD
jgi:hypothetical protein